MAFQDPRAGFTSSSVENPDQLLAHEVTPLTYKETLITGQNLKRGAMVGKITTGGKMTLSLSASGDGSQVPYGILAEDCDATSADKEALVFVKGSFNAHKVVLGTGWTAKTAALSLLQNTQCSLELNPVIAP